MYIPLLQPIPSRMYSNFPGYAEGDRTVEADKVRAGLGMLPCSLHQRPGKYLPGHHGGKGEQRIRQTAGRHVADLPEQKGKDRDRGQRLDDYPGDADGGLLIAHGNVAHHQGDEQLAPPPEFEGIGQPKTLCRLDHVYITAQDMLFTHGSNYLPRKLEPVAQRRHDKRSDTRDSR